MFTRIWVGLLAAALMIGVLYIGGVAVTIVAAVAALLCVYELFHALRQKSVYPNYILGCAFVLAMIPCAYFGGMEAVALLYTAFALGALALPLWQKSRSFPDALCTTLGMFYIGFPVACFLLTFWLPYGINYMGVLLALACPLLSDVFAYFVGSFLGKHKLCPKISPKKTIEGSVGGVLGSLLTALALGLWAQGPFGTDIPLMHCLLIGLLCAVFSQIGDLVASSIKRFVGIKDFGKLMPGHGGMLDRIDSVLFSLPVVYAYFIYILPLG